METAIKYGERILSPTQDWASSKKAHFAGPKGIHIIGRSKYKIVKSQRQSHLAGDVKLIQAGTDKGKRLLNSVCSALSKAGDVLIAFYKFSDGGNPKLCFLGA